MRGLKLGLGLLVGFVVVGLGIFYFENIGRLCFDEYSNAPYDPENLDAFIMSLPAGAFLALLLAHVGGVFLGALTASLIAGWKRYVPAIVIGVVLSSFSFINAYEIQHPLWYEILDVALVLPTALSAHKIYLSRSI
ncbi:MAG: hypothetical protein CMB32_07430 [Euryarchaeota archaeon]|nr:hypothetical protein [Euryarchaeota archaeon]|tara:strand:+ start:214 stop:621 length:408 start_codon:yes stop_codon:yes gene_type:complete